MRSVDDIIALDAAATYEAEEVALILFHIRPRTLARRMAKLRSEGFPCPISRWGKKIWSGQALLDWQNRPQKPAAQGAVVRFIGDGMAVKARIAARQGARSPR
jgi:hypothetical protein